METTATFGTYEILAILGALAWLPQVISFIYNKISKPKITIITDQDLEIGYTTLGPIFNIQISFFAENKKALIRSTEVEITHENNATQKFTWDWFEEILNEVNLPNSAPMSTRKNQKAIAIIIQPDSISEKKIGFQQNSFKDEQRRLLQLTTEEFLNISNAGEDINQIRTRTSFNNLKNYFKDGFTWKTGNYTANIIVNLSNGQTFNSQIEFQLTSLDLKTLESNIARAQKVIDKQYGAEVELDDNWLWVHTVKKKSS